MKINTKVGLWFPSFPHRRNGTVYDHSGDAALPQAAFATSCYLFAKPELGAPPEVSFSDKRAARSASGL